jgi:3-hydroxyisobutyrate dehydrogenase-like beta-hydroxyacid dehydrogenase
MTDTTIGFVGLGRMGRPMAGHLRAKGFVVQGYDANPNAAQGLRTAAISRLRSTAPPWS